MQLVLSKKKAVMILKEKKVVNFLRMSAKIIMVDMSMKQNGQ